MRIEEDAMCRGCAEERKILPSTFYHNISAKGKNEIRHQLHTRDVRMGHKKVHMGRNPNNRSDRESRSGEFEWRSFTGGR